MNAYAILVGVADRLGLLSALSKVLADHQANITYVDIHASGSASDIYFEFATPEEGIDALLADMAAVPGVQQVRETPSFAKIYGKRIVVIGGGAQVGLVATGAISEADRHNIRGERISVDTIPLVGEQELAAAVRATVRLPRVKMLVLAGFADGRRHHRGRPRGAGGRAARHLAEHGRQRPRRGRPGGDRSRCRRA